MSYELGAGSWELGAMSWELGAFIQFFRVVGVFRGQYVSSE